MGFCPMNFAIKKKRPGRQDLSHKRKEKCKSVRVKVAAKKQNEEKEEEKWG